MKLNIVVAGDINIDCYYWQREPKTISQPNEVMANYQLYKGLYIHRELGGSIVVSKLLNVNKNIQTHPEIKIRFTKFPQFKDVEERKGSDCNKNGIQYLYDQLPNTTIGLDKFSTAVSEKGEKTYRVKNFFGFTIPNDNNMNYIETLKLLNKDNEENDEKETDQKKNIIVLHDLGNGFRSKSAKDIWPKEIREVNNEHSFLSNTVIVYYMSPPLFEGDLWDHLQQHYKKNVILIVNAEELRNIKGVNISYSLSWEKTALDFLWEITKNSELQKIKGLPDVIVCFGLGGTIYYNGEGQGQASKLYFNPKAIEGRFWNEKKDGSMKGFSSVFVSSLVHRLIDNVYEKRDLSIILDQVRHDSIDEGIKYGLVKKHRFVKNGHGLVYGKTDLQMATYELIRESLYEGIKRGLDNIKQFMQDQTTIDEIIHESITEGIKYGLDKIKQIIPDSKGSVYENKDLQKTIDEIIHESITEGIKRGLDKIKQFMPDKTKTDEIMHESITEGIKRGLDKKQQSVKKYNESSEPEFFDAIADKLFNENFTQREVENIQNVELPDVNQYSKPDQNSWKIMEQETAVASLDTLDIAKNIVKYGLDAIKYYPIGSFGDLTTVDRAETESFRSIMNIMTEYIYSEKTVRPLSIAVFGSPGSGKSFGIIQIANNIDKEHVKKLEFNVSQFTSIRDLASAFHVIRDCSLKGLIPIVFFDEFDCNYQETPLGWLKYFLVPMQDGKFLDHGVVHPIGKSIFVFAGGVYEKFSDFCASTGVDSNIKNDSNMHQHLTPDILQSEKCPDFVSRLRGYVNILGLNPTYDKNKKDESYIIRRAILLRSLIERKAPCLITSQSENIKTGKIEDDKLDQELLDLLLKDVKYKHEIRSMEAILDMSLLERYKKWNLASLPSKEQLDLHIEVESSSQSRVFYNL
ncbi:MAG TPA: hypothetical protein VGK06_13970 [Methanosarcina sp.]|jgi:DNA replication protein DnaC